MVRSVAKRVVSAKTGGRDEELRDTFFQRRCMRAEDEGEMN